MPLLSSKCPRRFGEPFKGLIILFGAVVEYHPISQRDLSRIHQLGKKVLPRIFLGYELVAERTWKGDFPLADLDAEILFPIADGKAKLSGRDHEFREPTLRREPTVRSEEFSRKFSG